MSPDLRLRLHATQAQPCFPAASNALALPGGNGIFTATPAERITHYTLLRKVVCQMGALPPLETPTRKGGTLPLHGARTAFSCYPALRLYRLSKSPRGIDVVSLTLGNSGGTVDDSDDDVLEEESRMADAISGLKEQEVISASGDVNENKDYINILLIGTDERTEYFNDNARGDSCMILTLGKKDGSVKLASLERGMGVPILEGQYEGEYDWLTHTFRYGGADLMMREVRECFKVDVDRYIRVNFATFVQGIESVGGVDISLTEAEAAYINKFNKGGITCVAGQNHLDGRAALEYARCRKIDSDWQRVKRQRNVIQAAVNSTKDLSISELNDLMNQVFPLVQTNLSKLEITELLMLAPKCRGASIQQITIPIKDSYGGMTGLGGRSLFSVNFDTNARALREFMYGENSNS